MNGAPPGSSSRIPAVSLASYLEADAELLHRANLAVRVALLADPGLSLGVSQPDHASSAVRARAAGFPVVRRSTGGLALWHAPQDLAWSIVLPRTDPRVGQDFTRAYGRLGAGVVRWLAGYRVAASWVPPTATPGEYCLLSGAGEVLRVGGRVLGGASQHLTGKALLHHGILPYQVDPRPLQELFGLSPAAVHAKLVGLAEVLGGRPPLELAEGLERVLAAELAVRS